MTKAFLLLASSCLLASIAPARNSEAPEPTLAERARANFARPIVLAADDVRALPDAPEGFRTRRAGVPQGRIELFEYDSGVTGTRRKASVYLPPGCSSGQRYPVLFLLHGIGGDETEWLRTAAPNVILDNLIANGKATPMIVVMPNGRALPEDRPTANPFTSENAAGFAFFERDLLEFLLPAVQARYPVFNDRAHRALAGHSMGGGQALNIGLSHLDTFAWLGAFSAAPNTRPAPELLAAADTAHGTPALLYLSCGNKDGVIRVSQDVHRYLKAQGIPHIWNVDSFGHDGNSWADNFHHFAERIFR